jgi:hypothetical protein
LTDDEIVAASQQAAVAKMQARHGLSSEQIAKLQQSLAAPKQTEPNTVTAANIEAAWGRSANDQFRSLGITPVSDAEAAEIQAAMNAAVAKAQAEQAANLDDQLINFRLEVAHDQAARSGLYYSPDATKQREIERLVEKTETAMIEARLEAGLPAEPPARKTPVQIALERHNARRAGR